VVMVNTVCVMYGSLVGDVHGYDVILYEIEKHHRMYSVIIYYNRT
jgi:hypothetical protein